jgi:hypothetical protein
MTGLEIPPVLALLGTISGKVFNFVQQRRAKKVISTMAEDIATISYDTKELSNYIRHEFLLVREKLNSISEWFADEIRREALSAFSCIFDAINIDDEKLKSNLLLEGYKISTKLINLNPNNKILSESTSKNEVEYMISWGYWGRFIFFLLNNQSNFAEKQIYLCASKYPLIAVSLFPGAFFGEHFIVLEQVTKEIQKRIALPDSIYDEISVLDCSSLPSNIQLPLLEIQFQEELERLADFAAKKIQER